MHNFHHNYPSQSRGACYTRELHENFHFPFKFGPKVGLRIIIEFLRHTCPLPEVDFWAVEKCHRDFSNFSKNLNLLRFCRYFTAVFCDPLSCIIAVVYVYASCLVIHCCRG